MNKFQFLSEVLEMAGKSRGKLRTGQVLFNHLYEVRQDLADQIRGTDCDPFYAEDTLDQRFVRALEFLDQNWGEG